MIHTISLDPGKHGQAVAAFADGLLGGVWDTAKAAPVWGFLSAAQVDLVIEKPQYDKRSPGKVEDVIDMCAAGFLYAGTIHEAVRPNSGKVRVFTPRPREWKHSQEKPLHHRRALACLDPHEYAIVNDFWQTSGRRTLGIAEYVARACVANAARKTKRLVGYSDPIHNILDALALGLTHLGRMSKEQTFKRTRRTFTPKRSIRDL
jgi:hypothetical protein